MAQRDWGFLWDVFSVRPHREDPNDRPVVRDMVQQVERAHLKRVLVVVFVEALVVIPAIYWLFTLLHVFTEYSASGWRLGLPLVELVLGLSLVARYRCFCYPEQSDVVLLFVTHIAAGAVVGMAFTFESVVKGSQLRYYATVILSGAIAAGWSALEYFLRGQRSAYGWFGPQRGGREGRWAGPLARGYDVALFDTDAITMDVKSGGGHVPPVPRYARCLLPMLPQLPPDARQHSSFARVVVMSGTYVAAFIAASELRSAIFKAIVSVVLATLLQWALPLQSLAASFEHEWMSNFWSDAPGIVTVSFTAALFVSYALNLATLVLLHIMLQPVAYSSFDDEAQGRTVLETWLERGWVSLLRSPPVREQNRLVVSSEEVWRTDLNAQRELVVRMGVTVDNAYFPPRVVAHNRISVMQKLYRALAFQDLAVAAKLQIARRKWIYYDFKKWSGYYKPAIAAINALTLQLELQVEAANRVEGAVATSLGNVYDRAGVPEPRDAESIPRLVIEGEVQRRLEHILLEKQKTGEPIEPLPPRPLLPAKTLQGGWLPTDTLDPVPIATLDVQVVENAVEALGDLYQNSMSIEKAKTRNFEDPRGSAKQHLPSTLASLIGCQLAIHAYSDQAMSRERHAAIVRFRDRRNIIHPKFLKLSQAIDHAINQILFRYYEGDLQSFTFPPLYAKCIGTYVRCLQRRET